MNPHTDPQDALDAAVWAEATAMASDPLVLSESLLEPDDCRWLDACAHMVAVGIAGVAAFPEYRDNVIRGYLKAARARVEQMRAQSLQDRGE